MQTAMQLGVVGQTHPADGHLERISQTDVYTKYKIAQNIQNTRTNLLIVKKSMRERTKSNVIAVCDRTITV